MNYLITSNAHNPYANLALEAYLMRRHADGALLYLWRNERTVVIGRNQNPWRECRVDLLRNEGGRLARRTSGGGAVYHDLGNLCYSFVMAKELYDLQRQLSVILAACASLGISAEFSGRNDILAGGRKFSGNAFKFERRAALQHGTLLVNADAADMARYLVPSAQKMRAKGVESVQARVCNLSGLAPVTCESLAAALSAAFEAEYGAAVRLDAAQFDGKEIGDLTARLESPAWLYGETPPFDAELEAHFDWGSVTLQLKITRGSIENASVYTDAMDAELAGQVRQALLGCGYGPGMGEALREYSKRHEFADLAAHLEQALG